VQEPAPPTQSAMTHESPGWQTVPQAPQLVLSACVSVQKEPHSTSGGGHGLAGTQAPAVHVRPAGQASPHAPQLVGSLCVSTQAGPHCTNGAGHMLAPPQTPAVQMPAQQSEATAQAAPFDWHWAPLWQAPSKHRRLQHSIAPRHGSPVERHDGSLPKSMPTSAVPARSISSRTIAVCPGVREASTGALTHVGADVAVTPAHAPGNAFPTKLTVPVGRPVTKRFELSMGMTSKLRVTVNVPVAVIAIQPTLPSLGTCVIAMLALPSPSGVGLEHAAPAPSQRAVSAREQPVNRRKIMVASCP
jgi:hypothetical protein